MAAGQKPCASDGEGNREKTLGPVAVLCTINPGCSRSAGTPWVAKFSFDYCLRNSWPNPLALNPVHHLFTSCSLCLSSARPTRHKAQKHVDQSMSPLGLELQTLRQLLID